MIPLRVAVAGFMSYRDEAELVFEGAPLWVLSGRNGSGKSAIFDAITYVLYGVHRGGSQNAKALINHDVKSLSVEFDFAIGDDTYRVKRTLGRRSTPTVQAFRLEGGVPVPIAETETKAGFDRWVLATIGLDVRTFTASVLLLQGKSEALLDADPKVRHEMLSQVIDLSAYQRLFERADERHRAARALAEAARVGLRGLEPVDEVELERIGASIVLAAREAEFARSRVERLLALKGEARRWTELAAERGRIEQEVAEAEALVARADAIERDAARHADLSRAVPALERLLDEGRRDAAKRAELAALEAQAERLGGDAERAAAALDVARAEADALAAERERARTARAEAAAIVAELAPHTAALDRLTRARATLAEVEGALAAFSATLDGDVERLRAEVEATGEARSVLPLLRIVAAARDAARRAEQDEAAAAISLDGFAGALAAAESAAERAARALDGATRAAEEAARRATEAGTLLAETQRRAGRFDEVAGQAACSTCGQPLTPDHLAAERERLERELVDREAASAEAARAAVAAASRRDRLAEEAAAATAESRRIAGERDALLRAAEAARGALAREQARSRDAVASLPPSYAARAETSTYPTAEDVRAVAHAAEGLEAVRAELARRSREVEDRAGVLGRRAAALDEVRRLEADYSEERKREIRTAADRAADAVRVADGELARLESPLAEAVERRDLGGREAASAADALTSAKAELGAARAAAEEIARALVRAEADVPDTWRALAATIDAARLAALRDEALSLAGAAVDRERLDEARRDARARERRLRETELEAERVPEEARRPPEELEADERAAREAFAAADDRRAEAESARRELETRRTRRAELERQFLAAQREEHLARELARLLGRDRLQRHLLVQAEAAITALANEVLDRLSGGTLWLELRREAEGEGKGTPKALDLVAYNSETGSDAIPVAFLSGSQRFRVAVSLALAIGRYAGQGGRRIESVIIDEGFGSLDREGRREMIDELHALKSALDRVILVSHQEEFAGAFANKYVVELVDGTSRARLSTDD